MRRVAGSSQPGLIAMGVGFKTPHKSGFGVPKFLMATPGRLTASMRRRATCAIAILCGRIPRMRN
jgi:hypothetical protein